MVMIILTMIMLVALWLPFVAALCWAVLPSLAANGHRWADGGDDDGRSCEMVDR